MRQAKDEPQHLATTTSTFPTVLDSGMVMPMASVDTHITE